MRWQNSSPLLSKKELHLLRRVLDLLHPIEQQACDPWRTDAYIAIAALEAILVRSTPKVTILKEYNPYGTSR